jgi:hypothetical protein
MTRVTKIFWRNILVSASWFVAVCGLLFGLVSLAILIVRWLDSNVGIVLFLMFLTISVVIWVYSVWESAKKECGRCK